MTTTAAQIRDRIVARAAETGFGAHGLHVLVGDDEASHRWTPDVREDVHSAAKGVCALAAGIAADEGLVDLDAPVAPLFPGVPLGDGVERITLRHLLTMTGGVDLPWTPTQLVDWPDLAAEYLGRPSRGRVFQYSNASTYTAMRALGAVVGDPAAFLADRLFAPLGIDDVAWERCPNGHVAAGGGLLLRTEELARVGRLLRDGGVWAGRRIVSAAFVDAMHGDWVAAGTSPAYDRYAIAGWGGPGAAWRLHGAHGQLVLVQGRSVVTITAHDHGGADAMAAYAVSLLDG